MQRYQNPTTNEVRLVRFKPMWAILYPLFVIELLAQGFVIAAVLSILPLFAIIYMFRYSGMMERRLLKQGWVKINEFGQPITLAQA